MDIKYVRTEGNTEVHQYSNVTDCMELIQYYTLTLGRIMKINIMEYKENELISDRDYESPEALKQIVGFIPSDFDGRITICSIDRNQSVIINTSKKEIYCWEKNRSVEFSKGDLEETVFRIQSFLDFKIWNKHTQKWEICHNHNTYYDISGRGGSWYNYTDISRAEAWEFVKETGGTWEEFISEEAEIKDTSKDM